MYLYNVIIFIIIWLEVYSGMASDILGKYIILDLPPKYIYISIKCQHFLPTLKGDWDLYHLCIVCLPVSNARQYSEQ